MLIIFFKEIEKETKKEDDEMNDSSQICPNLEDLHPISVITTNHVSSGISSDFIIRSKIYQQNGRKDDQDDSKMDFDSHRSYSPPLSPPPARPRMTVLEATETIMLPNGITLPPGTKQIIVHPYNRPIY